MGGWASLQHPTASTRRNNTETTHLVIMDPERFQIVGLCARNDFNVINLFHSLQLQADWGLTDAGSVTAHTDCEGMSTETGRGHKNEDA